MYANAEIGEMATTTDKGDKAMKLLFLNCSLDTKWSVVSTVLSVPLVILLAGWLLTTLTIILTNAMSSLTVDS